MPNFCTYFIVQGYVGNIKEILFSKSEKELNAIKKKYAAKVSPPLNTHPDRTAKDEAIKQQRKRKQKAAELFPSGTINKLHLSLKNLLNRCPLV